MNIITSTTIAEIDTDVDIPDWLLDDLADIHDYLIELEPVKLYYKDGTEKPWTAADVRNGSFVQKAQASWSWDDGEPNPEEQYRMVRTNQSDEVARIMEHPLYCNCDKCRPGEPDYEAEWDRKVAEDERLADEQAASAEEGSEGEPCPDCGCYECLHLPYCMVPNSCAGQVA